MYARGTGGYVLKAGGLEAEGAGREEGRTNSGKRDVTSDERCFSLPASPNPRAFLNLM
jgi:hypothetical protein